MIKCVEKLSKRIKLAGEPAAAPQFSALHRATPASLVTAREEQYSA
jgi:hypothetical protein